jgi:DNA-binding MarR family transcriptional regulator
MRVHAFRVTQLIRASKSSAPHRDRLLKMQMFDIIEQRIERKRGIIVRCEMSSAFCRWLEINNFHLKVETALERSLQTNHNLSLKEFYVLYFLSQEPEWKLKLQDLEEKVGLSQSAVSRLVSKFEAKGCGALERNICDADRRIVYTSLTETGAAKLEAAAATVEKVLAESFSEMPIQKLIEKADDQNK